MQQKEYTPYSPKSSGRLVLTADYQAFDSPLFLKNSDGIAKTAPD